MKILNFISLLLVFNSLSAQDSSAIAERRISNLNVLATVWGELYLLHPNVVRNNIDVDWQNILINAIPKIENSSSDTELAINLNNYVFKLLGDPLCFAVNFKESTTTVASSVNKINTQKFDKSTLYVDLSNYQTYTDTGFINQFNNGIKDISAQTKLIIDLRWKNVTEDLKTEDIPKQYLFRFFIKDKSFSPSLISRAHYGWNEFNYYNVFHQKWEINNIEPLASIEKPERWVKGWNPSVVFDSLRILSNPVLFLINNMSYQFLYPYLDILQKDNNAKVVWEQNGVCTLREESAIKLKADLFVNLNCKMLFSHKNTIGFQADSIAADLNNSEIFNISNYLFSHSKKNQENERDNLEMKFPVIHQHPNVPLSREEKLLGLFKIWIVIDYFYPHLQYAAINWKNMLNDWIPKIENTKSDKEYYIALEELGATLNDSHVSVYSKSIKTNFEEYSVPLELAYLENKTIIVDVKPDSNGYSPIKKGDELIEIDGISVKQVEENLKRRNSASTPQSMYWWLYNYNLVIRRSKGTPVKLKVKQGEKINEYTLVCTEKPWVNFKKRKRTGPASSIISGNMGYIDLTRIAGTKALDSAIIALKETDGLLLDMRGYYQTFGAASELVSRICNYPVKSGIIEKPIVTTIDSAHSANSITQYTVQPNEKYVYTKPIVMLINELQQSSPENLMIYIKNAKRVVFVGSPTTGTNGNVTEINLPGDGNFSFTGSKVTYADGTRFQNIGILPDIEVHPTVKGVLEGRDEIMEKGIHVLAENIKKAR